MFVTTGVIIMAHFFGRLLLRMLKAVIVTVATVLFSELAEMMGDAASRGAYG